MAATGLVQRLLSYDCWRFPAGNGSGEEARTVLINNLRWGVLRLLTPVGPRYVQPAFWERVYLLWVFRHFQVLPQNVLSRRAHSLIENLCMRQHSQSHGFLYAITDQPVIGTVDRVPQFGLEESPVGQAKGVTTSAALSRHNS